MIILLYIILFIYCILLFYLIFKPNDNFENNNFKIIVSNIETNIEIINKTNFNNYKKDLDNLYKKCKFRNGYYSDFNLNNSESILFILKHNNTIIGSLQIDDFDKLNKIYYVNTIGAIENKKGLYLTFLCGNNNYKGITKPLFDAVEIYAKKYDYEYILLQTDGQWRKKYYSTFGYKIIYENELASMIKMIKY